ncbi:probable inactive tRNA-specific adenosine deaminase-like protein 3 isoform X2 [Actinia tenebrosa]|uniref:Probable inactive tRNA-specific adenosine deaminase-like protein 3 isoform X2 n=1 Tax=Actinia tenebrosa TaxID=6105 RepID=A0A6P8HN40_ACTTE|nr:probable inactive tRNA-specific adenosine deaminase-like protein 3 isoform X2 [Actinia tenebrosa]
MSNEEKREERAERFNKRIKLDLNYGSLNEEQFQGAQKAAKNLPKPVAVLSEEYTRINLDTVPVYVAELKDPKLASKCIRIRRPPTDAGGKQVLQIILRIVSEDQLKFSKNNIINIKDIIHGVNSEGLGNPFVIKVPRYPPLTREQFNKASELWPVNFHEDKYITKLLSGELFGDLALRKIYKYMDMARKSALIGKNNGMVAIGTVVVDPSSDIVIAVAYDLRCHGHPLHHAIMVVIDLVAQSQTGGTWNMGYQQDSGTWTLPENLNDIKIKKAKCQLDCEETSKEDTSKSKVVEDSNKTNKNPENKFMNENKNGPYLCTGYDLYVTREPCIMCSMALVHSRIRRVFYGCKDPSVGALGSKYRLHTQDGLNHHFEVFCGILEKECSELIE